MSKADLLFHIAKKDGLEFVFNSGNALNYPMYCHFSVYTITVVRRGIVNLAMQSSADIYSPGSVYIVEPYELHSPAYTDKFDIVSLCINKDHFIQKDYSVAAICLKYAQVLMERGLLSADIVSKLMSGIELIYANNIDAELKENTKQAFLDSLELSYSKNSANNFLQLSRFHFIRKFKSLTGLTPYQYITQIRMREVKQLLATGLSIANAAALAGFCDQSHLNRWFNRNVGITPYAYKQSCLFFE